MIGLLRLYVLTDILDKCHSSDCFQPGSFLLVVLIFDKIEVYLGDCHCCNIEKGRERESGKIKVQNGRESVGSCDGVLTVRVGLELAIKKTVRTRTIDILLLFMQYSYKHPILKIKETIETAPALK